MLLELPLLAFYSCKKLVEGKKSKLLSSSLSIFLRIFYIYNHHFPSFFYLTFHRLHLSQVISLFTFWPTGVTSHDLRHFYCLLRHDIRPRYQTRSRERLFCGVGGGAHFWKVEKKDLTHKNFPSVSDDP